MERLFSIVCLGKGFYYYALLWTFIFFAPIIAFVVWFRTRRITKVMNSLHGPPANPIFRQFLGNYDGFIKAYFTNGFEGVWKHSVYVAETYGKGDLIKFWASWIPTVGFLKADVTESLFTSQEALEKAYPYKFLHSWLGTGLLTSSGNKWKTRRRLLTPTFHFRILEDFVHIFNEQSMVLVEKLRQYTGKPAIDISSFLKSCTLDIICETAMGVQIGAQKDQCPEYVKATDEVTKAVLKRYITPWLWNDLLFSLFPEGRRFKANLNILHSFTNQVLQEKKSRMLSQQTWKEGHEENTNVYIGRKKRESFLDLLLHYHLKDGTLSEEDIREEVDTFMFEGHDTTSTGIGWALYTIGHNPIVQQKITEELDGIFGADTKRDVTPDDLKEMKYLECVLKESQRMYPSVPLIGRKLNADLDLPSVGVTLPKGITVFSPIYYLHRDENVFPDPEKFDPDRFLPENCQNRHPFAYIPFSAGPRNCIGQKFAMMEEKIAVSNILRHFTIRSVDPPESLVILPALVLRSVNGIKIEIKEKITD